MINLRILAFASILMATTQSVAQDTASQSSEDNMEPDMQFGQRIEEPPEAQQAPQADLRPFEFFGLTIDRVYDGKIEFAGKTCRIRANRAEQTCARLFGGKIGNANVSPLVALFENGKLDSVIGGADVSEFRELADAFAAKYGEPDKTEETTVQNRMGAEFEQVTMKWQFSDGVLVLQARGSTIDESRFYFVIDEKLDEPKESPPINF